VTAVRPPPDYQVDSTIDLKDDRQAAVAIQTVFVLTVAAAIGVAIALDLPFGSSWSTGAIAAFTALACAAYMVVHELTHGLFIRLVSGESPSYSVRLPYLTTGSAAYFDRRGAVTVALAPALSGASS